jgi:ssDNA-binding replication factor A large subunit
MKMFYKSCRSKKTRQSLDLFNTPRKITATKLLTDITKIIVINIPRKGVFHLKISQIRAGMNGVIVTGKITDIGIKRTVETRYGPAQVATATLEDDTGRIVLNLWRGQIDLVRVGDRVKIENGFTRTYRDQLELNVGSRGRIVIVSRG